MEELLSKLKEDSELEYGYIQHYVNIDDLEKANECAIRYLRTMEIIGYIKQDNCKSYYVYDDILKIRNIIKRRLQRCNRCLNTLKTDDLYNFTLGARDELVDLLNEIDGKAVG